MRKTPSDVSAVGGVTPPTISNKINSQPSTVNGASSVNQSSIPIANNIKRQPTPVGLSDPTVLSSVVNQLVQASTIANGKLTTTDFGVVSPYTTTSTNNNSVSSTTNSTVNSAGDVTVTYSTNKNLYVSSIDQNITYINQLGGGDVSLDTVNIFTKNQSVNPSVLTSSGGTTVVNAALSNNFLLVMTENTTLQNPTNPTPGMVLNIAIVQNGTGGWTLGFGDAFAWPGGTAPTLSTTAGAIDFISMYYVDYTGTSNYKWLCVMSQDFGPSAP